MPTNLNALLIAWAVSLIVVLGGITMLEVTHQPAENPSLEDPVSDAQTPADATSGSSNLPAPGETALSTGSTSNALDLTLINNGIPERALGDLLEETNLGFLPKIAQDGRKSYTVYASKKQYNEEQPRIALIMTNLGKLSRNTQRALDRLPSEIGLAFSPYAANLNKWGHEARLKGFEVFLTVPMEPENYPQNDPGPFTLKTDNPTNINISVLKDSLKSVTGYVGVIDHMGSRFSAAPESLRPILQEINKRGLMYIDSRSSKYSQAASMARAIGIPTAISNETIDESLAIANIKQQLVELEKRAQIHGAALGIAHPYPVTINAINEWKETLATKGFILVPVSAVANRQPLPR